MTAIYPVLWSIGYTACGLVTFWFFARSLRGESVGPLALYVFFFWPVFALIMLCMSTQPVFDALARHAKSRGAK